MRKMDLQEGNSNKFKRTRNSKGSRRLDTAVRGGVGVLFSQPLFTFLGILVK